MMPAAKRISRAEFERLWITEEWGGQRVADHFGVDRSTVTKWARAFGLPLRLERRKARWVVQPDQVNELVAMWRARVKMAEIARHFGCDRRTIENAAKRSGEGNRGKAPGVTFLSLAQYREINLARRLAQAARAEQAALVNAEMVDSRRSFDRMSERAA